MTSESKMELEVKSSELIDVPLQKRTGVEKLKCIEDLKDSISTDSSYKILPSLHNKFQKIPVKEIIRNVVAGVLTGKTYDPDKAKSWTMQIANAVNERVKELQMNRYKHVVQVIVGEMKGAGIKSGARCVWDSDVDSYANEIYMGETIFCATTVFGVFHY